MFVPLILVLNSQVKIGQDSSVISFKATNYLFQEPQMGYLKSLTWTANVPSSNMRKDPFPAVTSKVKAAMKDNGIPGAAVVIMEDDKIVYQSGFGYANLTNGQRFEPGTASRCGSISKTATSLAILRLVNAGKLSLDEKVLPLLDAKGSPKVKPGDKPGWETIRVRDLLDQSSGLKNNSTYLTSHQMADSLGDLMRLYKQDLFNYVRKNVQLYNVGSQWAYTNLNFELLSLIIEKKTGKKFADALDELVVEPLAIPTNEMYLSPTSSRPPDGKLSIDVKANVIRTARTKDEAHCYQRSDKMFESIFDRGKMLPEAYGGLDGDILSGAGHVAFSARAIAQMVITLRTRPTSFLKQSIWDDLLTPPEYVAQKANNYTKNYFYSKGTWVTKTENGYQFNHGAMLMHAGGNYTGYGKNMEFVVISNCNMEAGKPTVDVILGQAVQQGLQASGK